MGFIRFLRVDRDVIDKRLRVCLIHKDAAVPSERQQINHDVMGLYKILLDTRNLEISLFWQRSNYFLILNSGIAFGFFNQLDSPYGVVLAVIGLLASILWFRVCLGSKYWQSRWEQRLFQFEMEHFAGIAFFAASPEQIKHDVARGLGFHKLGRAKRFVYRMVLQKPSVSFAMISLSALFVLSWTSFIVTFLVVGKNPFSK